MPKWGNFAKSGHTGCWESNRLAYFVDVEGTKEVKRMMNLLAITVNLYHGIDADPSGSGSKTDRVRKYI